MHEKARGRRRSWERKGSGRRGRGEEKRRDGFNILLFGANAGHGRGIGRGRPSPPLPRLHVSGADCYTSGRPARRLLDDI